MANMPRWPFVAALGVALGAAYWRRKDVSMAASLVFGNHAEEELVIRKALNDAAGMGNLDGDMLNALAKVESNFRMNAVNKSGRDGARGGSYGATQISEKTVRALGYTGDMMEFTKNPLLMALWTAKILNDHRSRGKLETLADYVAAWNAGRDGADKNGDNNLEELGTNSAATDYLPKAKVALAYVQASKVPA